MSLPQRIGRRKHDEQPAQITAGGRRAYEKTQPAKKRNIAALEARLAIGCDVCGTHENVEVHHVGPKSQGRTSMRRKAQTMGEEAFATELSSCRVECKAHHRATHKYLKAMKSKADGSSVGKLE
jgi:hypothetical protein